MSRARALRVLLALLGLIFLASVYAVGVSLLGLDRMSVAEEMILSMYIPQAVFLLLAVRDPSAHRALIQCVGWLNLAHAGVMLVQVLQGRGEPGQLPFASALAILSLALLVLAARGRANGRAPQAAAAPARAPELERA